MQLGAYKLAERIGAGRLAQVYRATDGAGHPVAVKLLSPEAHLDDPAARERFGREIEMLSRVRHPNVIALLGHGVDDELGPYLVTPLVQGVTLRQLLAQGPALPEVALLGIREIAAGIAAMHAVGVVHRDLKPENIMIQHDGHVIVIDLGLAYQANQTRYTEEGAVAGSVPYMAPEQIEAVTISPATDVWALGVIFYEWIAGRRPFERNRPSEEVAAILSGRYENLVEVNPCATQRHDQLVARCVVSTVSNRLRNAAELVALIETHFDWPNAQDHARSAFKAPAAYAEKLSLFRASELASQASKQLGRGEVFAATRTLQRGLAYRPGDPQLSALLDNAAKSPRRRTRSVLPMIAAATALVMTVGVGVWWMTRAQHAGTDATSAETALATVTVDAGPSTNRAGLVALVPNLLPNKRVQRASVLAVYKPKLMEGLFPRKQFKGNPYNYTIAAAAGTFKVGKDVAAQLQMIKAYMVGYQKAKALALLDQLAEQHPKNADVWAFRGYIETRRARWKAADRHFTKAIALAPNHADALRQRGTLRLHLGLVRDAYADLVHAVALEPDNTLGIRGLAGVYRTANKPAVIKPLLERALTAEPDNVDLLIDTALSSEGDQARQLMKRAMTKNPSNKRTLRERCLMLARQKHTSARIHCATAQTYLFRDVDVVLAAGYANLRENRIEKAKYHFIMASVRDRSDPRGPLAMLAVHKKIHSTWMWLERELRKACERGAKNACNELNQGLKKRGKAPFKPGPAELRHEPDSSGSVPGIPATTGPRGQPATPATPAK